MTKPTELVTDDDLDLVETRRLIAALARRHQCLIVAGIVEPDPKSVEPMVAFLPNAILCHGLFGLASSVMAVQTQILSAAMANAAAGVKQE